MIQFFDAGAGKIYAIEVAQAVSTTDLPKLQWLFGNASLIDAESLDGFYTGPRKEMITPWSTNAVEITQNMGISGISRIEEFFPYEQAKSYDPMLQSIYDGLGDDLYTLDIAPEKVLAIDDIGDFNDQESLALSAEEITYLEGVSEQLGRNLTDSEVFGFSQVNSEHCRHKIFNGQFIIDGEEMPSTLFQRNKKRMEMKE